MRTFVSGCVVTAFAISLSACDAAQNTRVAIATAPSASPSITASIGYVTVPSAPAFAIPAYATNGCTAYSQAAAAFDIVIVASARMDLDHVTIHLIDGSNVGGPMVTIPHPTLTTQFGTTLVLPGVARTFRFSPQFQCGSIGANHVSAQLTLLDAGNTPRSLTVVGPLP